MAKHYPDISHYAPVTDWEAVKKTCPFLISKATEGTSFIDSTLTRFIEGCEGEEIPYWLYAYLKAGNEREQAKFLVSTCKNRVGSWFRGYILDTEESNTASNVQSALDYLNGRGGKTMLYTMYADYEKYRKIIDSRPASCAWWEARYGKNDGTYNSKYPCHSGVDLHQYTDRGKVTGIDGDVDLNRLTGAKVELWFTAKDTVMTTASVTMRQAAGKASRAVGTMRRGMTLQKTEETANWMQTVVWVAKKHCTIQDDRAVLDEAAPARARNASSSTKLGTLDAGAALSVLQSTANWIQVPVWIAKKYTE
jgi:GH25 family lysozyme M1 (1,4-beta-N-acetylmuramidase)